MRVFFCFTMTATLASSAVFAPASGLPWTWSAIPILGIVTISVWLTLSAPRGGRPATPCVNYIYNTYICQAWVVVTPYKSTTYPPPPPPPPPSRASRCQTRTYVLSLETVCQPRLIPYYSRVSSPCKPIARVGRRGAAAARPRISAQNIPQKHTQKGGCAPRVPYSRCRKRDG